MRLPFRVIVCIGILIAALLPLWATITDHGTYDICGRALEALDVTNMRKLGLMTWSLTLAVVGLCFWTIVHAGPTAKQALALSTTFLIWKAFGLGLALTMTVPCWEPYGRPGQETQNPLGPLFTFGTLVAWLAFLAVLLYLLLVGNERDPRRAHKTKATERH